MKKPKPGLREQLSKDNTTYHDGKLTLSVLSEWFDDIWYEDERKIYREKIELIRDIDALEKTNMLRLVKSNQFDLLKELLKMY